jgi:hypothetical protein
MEIDRKIFAVKKQLIEGHKTRKQFISEIHKSIKKLSADIHSTSVGYFPFKKIT